MISLWEKMTKGIGPHEASQDGSFKSQTFYFRVTCEALAWEKTDSVQKALDGASEVKGMQ